MGLVGGLQRICHAKPQEPNPVTPLVLSPSFLSIAINHPLLLVFTHDASGADHGTQITDYMDRMNDGTVWLLMFHKAIKSVILKLVREMNLCSFSLFYRFSSPTFSDKSANFTLTTKLITQIAVGVN